MNRFAVGDKAVIDTDHWDKTGKVSPFRKGAVVEVTRYTKGAMYPYTVKPTDGTATVMYVKEFELAPYVEPTPKFQRGDKVKVTFEAEVTKTGVEGFEVGVDMEGSAPLYHWFGPRFVEATAMQAEKIEPPVETFGPGDVVRLKGGCSGYRLLLTTSGYVNLDCDFEHFSTGTPKWDSSKFERVTLVEPPL